MRAISTKNLAILLLTTITLSTGAWAEETTELPQRYRVEFIVFKHNDTDLNEENLSIIPADSQFFSTAGTSTQLQFDEANRGTSRRPIEVPATSEGRVAISDIGMRILGSEELQLSNTFKHLDRLEAYTPLVHGGWEQNEIDESTAVAIDLDTFKQTEVAGKMRLHVSRYLHMNVDLAIDRNRTTYSNLVNTASDRSDNAFPSTRLNPLTNDRYYLYAQRRILRDELNYFDHPAVGVLLRITIPPETLDTTESETAGPSI